MRGGAAAEVRVGAVGVVEHAAASTEKIRIDSRRGNLMRDTEIEKTLHSNAIFNARAQRSFAEVERGLVWHSVGLARITSRVISE